MKKRYYLWFLLICSVFLVSSLVFATDWEISTDIWFGDKIWLSIVSFWNMISDWFDTITTTLFSFFQSATRILSYVWSFFETIYYWLTTVLSWTADMVNKLFNSSFS